jgi:hypothetical protein
MLTEDQLADQLRARLRQEVATIHPRTDLLPGLRRRQARRPVARWLAPLAAAAAVAAVVATSLVISGTFHRQQRTGAPAASAPAGVPHYYVALRFSGAHRSCCNVPTTRAAVVDTATGAVLATIAPPRPYVTFAGVTGAAADRTFVVAAQGQGTEPVTQFFLLRINPAAPPAQRMRLSRLPIPAGKNGILTFALSPDGRSLAVADFTGLHIFNLPTGTQRTWHPSLGGANLDNATTDALLSWAADSRHLAFAYNSDTSSMGAYLLDTRAPGSRLVHAPVPGTNATPWYQIRLTADGRTVIAVLAAPNRRNPNGAAQKLKEFSARTGRLLRVLNYLPVWNYTDVEQVLWASPSGHTLLVANTKPYPGKRRASFLLGHTGLLTGHRFTPLPWFTNTLAAAW